MAYIYKITNVINGKSYIGKTQFTVEFRFRQHISDSKKKSHENRPLYRAMNKYGIENFTIITLEETDSPEEREIYWIKFYNTYGSAGYNATLGGDGKAYVDEGLILFCLMEVTTNCSEVARIVECDPATVRSLAKKNNLYVKAKTSVTRADKDLISKIKELYIPGRKGFGKRKIAKLLNLEVQFVENAIRLNV